MNSSQIEFFTATCLNWQNLLEVKGHKEIVIDSLKFLVKEKRIWLYGYVLMPNHIHLLWRKQDAWIEQSVQQHFLKFTAQQMRFNMLSKGLKELELYRSTQRDRQYHFWERRPYNAQLFSTTTFEQKLNYIHQNPVRKGLCRFEEEYRFSSAKFYQQQGDEFEIITHYREHI